MSPISPSAGLISHALAMQPRCNSCERGAMHHAITVQQQCKTTTDMAVRLIKRKRRRGPVPMGTGPGSEMGAELGCSVGRNHSNDP